MTLLADESVARAIIERLRTDGLTVTAIAEISPGVDDTQVLGEADRTQAVLLTEDKDFGELVYRRGAANHGVVLIRLAGLSRAARADLVSEAFKNHAGEFVGAFTVIASAGIRIRPAPPPTGDSGT
jgi:predicted nuclease of predicted toxin-antitoxin system